MWEIWTKICEANLDHYNNHRAQHNAITVVWAVGAVVVFRKMRRKIAKDALK